MKQFLAQHLVRAAAIAFAVSATAVAIIHGGRGEDGSVIAPLQRENADALVSELTRCRTIRFSETSALEACRRIWADNRRQFFAPARSPQPPAALPTVSLLPLKTIDRVMPFKVEQQQSETR